MLQSIIMIAAAINLCGVGAFVTPKNVLHVLGFQFFPILISVGLVVFALARFMGWPI